MKHDLEAFSRDIVGLIKSSGDTGDIGDRPGKSLHNDDFSATTQRNLVSPLDFDRGQLAAASGDGKGEGFKSVSRGVPNVPGATTNFEGARKAAVFEDSPAGWHAISAELKTMPAPDWAGVDRWSEIIDDADLFLSEWGETAHRLGWTALNLFGVHPAAPGSRFDMMGLVPILRCGRVAVLTERTASIRQRSGAMLSFSRASTDGAVLLCGGQHAIR